MKLEAKTSKETVALEIRPHDAGEGGERFEIAIDSGGRRRDEVVEVVSRTGNRWTLRIGNRIEDLLIFREGDQTRVDWNGRVHPIEIYDPRSRLLAAALGGGEAKSGILKAQMPGQVVKVLKDEGEEVTAGEGLVVIEAMKMQNELKAPRSGIIKKCGVGEGENVEGGQLLFEIE